MNTALQGTTTGDDSIPPDFSRRFFKAQAAKLKPMWSVLCRDLTVSTVELIDFNYRASGKLSGILSCVNTS